LIFSDSPADAEPEPLLIDFVATANGAKRQRLSGSTPVAGTNDDSSQSLSPKVAAPAATSPDPVAAGSVPTAAASAVSSGVADDAASSQAADNGCNKENVARVDSVRAGLSCTSGKPGDVITLSDSDDGGDEKGTESCEDDVRNESPQHRKRKHDECGAGADDPPPAASALETKKQLRLVRRWQNELRNEETKLMLLQRLKTNQVVLAMAVAWFSAAQSRAFGSSS